MSVQSKKMGRPKKAEADKSTAWLSAIRVTKAVKARVTEKAKRAGFGKKLAQYRVACYMGLPPDPLPGLPVDEVMLDLADLGRLHQYTKDNPAAEELRLSLVKRHMDVIKPKL